MASTRKGGGKSKSRVSHEVEVDVPGRHASTTDPTPLPFGSLAQAGELTGRYLVLFDENQVDLGARTLEATMGVSVAAAGADETTDADVVVFDALGAGIMSAPPDQFRELGVASAGGQSGILAVEPERILYALVELQPQLEQPMPFVPGVEPGPAAAPPTFAPVGAPLLSRDYLLGFRDAISTMLGQGAGAGLAVPAGPAVDVFPAVQPAAFNEQAFTWGLQVTGVNRSPFLGKGISVAVLDTGIARHVDFEGRAIQSRSFVRGQAVTDRHGHGTHCAGTACGPAILSQSPRYGVAGEADLFVGKVLSDAGVGREGDILDGVNWAIRNNCAVVSMSLGAPVAPGQPFSAVFEGIAQRALRRGILIVAAAGNDSRRPGYLKPVSHPANCPSVMAVAAVDQRLQVASFSNSGINPNGGGVDIAAPGVDVYSSYATAQPGLGPYRRLNGTSMATPHVAGIAALWAEKTGARGRALWQQLVASSRRLPGATQDIGAGLVQAPQG